MSFTVQVAEAVQRVRAHDARTRCFVSTRLEEALGDASRRRDEPSTGPLHGVPWGLKDDFDTPHLPTTGGSWRHRERVTPGVRSAPYEAFEAAGAVLIGKTNLSDMGLAPEATNHIVGSTQNPFDATRTAGGSTGGGAAAVAYGFQGFDWGTDIGGSIRLPAAFCGVLGLKLSQESWPIRELFPSVPTSMRWMCGQGPLANTTAQLRAILEAAAPVMRRGAPRPFDVRHVDLYAPLAGRWPSFEAEVAPLLRRALELPVQTTDALPTPFQLSRINLSVWASHLEQLVDSEPSLDLMSGVRAALGGALFRGRFGQKSIHPLSAELLLIMAMARGTVYRDRDRALERVSGVRRTFDELWRDGRLLVAPVCAYPPPKIGRSNRNPHLLAYTVGGNLADATGLAIPFGTFDGRLPRAIQLLGPPGSEETLLDIADRIIAARDERPELSQPPTRL